MHLSSEDAASVAAVVQMLEGQAAKLKPVSRVAGLWSEWAALLRPTADAVTHEPLSS